MELKIESYVGVGPIKFGMTRDQVCQSIGKQPGQFLKGPESVIATDDFGDLGFHVYYKAAKEDVCDAIEMFSPADPIFIEQQFINRPFDEILIWFKNLDPSVEIGDAGLTSYELGVGVYAGAISKNCEAPVQSVIVFGRDYYRK
jgi:hypothetical protein